jgi:predicted Zn-dependent peptidase
MTEELRRVQPPVYPVGNINIPEVSSGMLLNGVPYYLIEAGTENVTRIEFIFRAGFIKDHMTMLASATNAMLTEGSQNYTSGKLQEEIDYYGAFLHMSVDRDRAGLVIFTLNKHLDKILELSHEILFRPVFPLTELNALLKKRLQWFRINKEKVQNLAYDQFFESVFGKHHPYGRQLTEEDFDRISPALLADFHRKYYTPGNMAIIVSGRIPVETRTLLNKYFGNIETGNPATDDDAGKIRGEKQRKKLVEKKGAVQSAIRIGSSTINKRHPDYPALKVLDSVLGGYFGSRLMRNIREDKGYTYGIRSSVSSMDLSGYKVISTEVGTENLSRAIDEIYKEIRLLQEQLVEPEELDTVRNYMAGEMLRMFDGPFAVAESFKSAWEFGLDNSYYYRFAEKIRTITPDEIKSLAATYYNIDDLYEIIAGPK